MTGKSFFKLSLIIITGITGLSVSLKFPDLDIKILGIGMHRFFLFHSAFFPLVFYMTARLILKPTGIPGLILSGFCAAFAAGTGIHLLTDVFQSKAVIFPFIGSLVDGTSLDDRLWLLGNALACLVFSFILYRHSLKPRDIVSIPSPLPQPVRKSIINTSELPSVSVVFEIYGDKAGEYRFRLKSSDDTILLHSEGYTTKQACRQGVKLVKHYAAVSPIRQIEE